MELGDVSKSTGSVKERRTVNVMIRDDCNKMCSANLNKSLLILSYPTNMFSVVSAVEIGSAVIFSPEESVLISSNGEKFNLKQNGKLFDLPTYDIDSTSSVRNYSLEQLHKTMGNWNVQDLLKLGNVAKCVKVMGSNEIFYCETCLQCKQTRNVISNSRYPFNCIPRH